ncbi:rhodanese-like domain-containing protein [Bacillus swezeyi]|uniref:Rhodanese-like domain-containing protein n=1 Tax=Bacillus swezeyi TaxID=1925020 RepID=A0A5M8RJG3_9BACI|nr:rhodanese-like domain-containing protein [Bacillus swezeyi]KAA6447243.1 rhodanese-like domain-containing protein [Bacillus swezeyi]KAA6472933.1 rhodanese-like domain-containing protein [Bacillus swezeyi]TYS32783.1 rhodanese-like domain-containing protein [Bacillus swezeyi]
MNPLDFFNARLEATISPMDFVKSAKINPETYFLVDVRNGPSEFKKVTIKDAQVIPEQDLPHRLNDIPKDKEIIVYCWDVWCNTAAKAAKFLLENGYQVKELTGGIAAWREMNFPVSACTEGETDKDHCGC